MKAAVVPDLLISLESEPFNDQTKSFEVVLKTNSERIKRIIPIDDPYKLITYINGFLPERLREQEFVEYDTGGDSCGFIILHKNLIVLAKNNKFIKITNP